jgi:hypothetical protein
MFGRKAKRIKELEGEIKKHEVVLFDKIDAILRMNVTINENKDTITHLEIALRDAEEAMDLLRAQPATEATKVVTTEPLEWTDGEPKEKGFYFVATNKWADHGYETTTLFYNPAARCRWMRGDQGNSERFEGEVIAHIKAPEYK